ncbi:MAG: hypothetical protein ACTSU5_05235, partial [Promethearchaeota archaeon]
FGLIFGWILLVMSYAVAMYVVRGHENKIGIGARLLLVVFVGGWLILAYVVLYAYGILTLLVNPILYVFGGIPAYLIYKTERNQKSYSLESGHVGGSSDA